MLSMTTIEKPTLLLPEQLKEALPQPTPRTAADRALFVEPELSRGDILPEPDDMSRTVLGKVATREEYRNEAEPELNPSLPIEEAQSGKATLGYSPEDDKKNAEYTRGFTLHEDSETNSDIDELPEGLKDVLGEPDNDEEIHG